MPVFDKELLDGFDKATALPLDSAQRQRWQAANRSWWESNPMQYNWNDPLPFEQFSREWYREIDRRFFADSQTYAPYKRIPFDPLIDFSTLPARDVLEIGVGMGTHAQLLATHARSFTGIDLTERAIQTTKRRFDLAPVSGKLLRMDAESLKFPDNSFDTVWSWGVIHHSSNTPKILSEIRRVLRPGGQARIMVYHRGALYYMLGLSGALRHGWQRSVQRRTDGALARYYSVPEWNGLGRKTGFRIAETRILGSIQEAIPFSQWRRQIRTLQDFPQCRRSRTPHACPVGKLFVLRLGKDIVLVDQTQPNLMSSIPIAEDEILIEPGKSEKHYWADLWRYRELFVILAWRDISVRYKQTVIGVAWAVVRPFLNMVIFTVIFSRVAGLHSDGGAPYALMVFAAMLPWTLFSTALGEASNSLIGNERLISKVYFPRLIIPTATVVTAFVDFLISFGILLGLMVYYRFLPSWNFLMLPIFVILALLVSLGPGLWMTALNVKYRDFRYMIPFVVQFGLYVSPVGFSSSAIPKEWRFLYNLNPLVGVIDGFRWCILGSKSPVYWQGFLVSMTITAFFLWLGISRFRKMEKTFADLI